MAKPEPTTAVVKPMTFSEMANELVNAPSTTAEEILNELINSDTVDELFGESTALHVRDLIGVPMTLLNVKLNKSGLKEGYPVYAVIDVEFDNSERYVVTTGAGPVLAQMIKAKAEGWFPIRVEAKESETRLGTTTIKFVKSRKPVNAQMTIPGLADTEPF